MEPGAYGYSSIRKGKCDTNFIISSFIKNGKEDTGIMYQEQNS